MRNKSKNATLEIILVFDSVLKIIQHSITSLYCMGSEIVYSKSKGVGQKIITIL